MSKKVWVVTSLGLLMVCSAAGWFAWLRPPRQSATTPPPNAIVTTPSSPQSDKIKRAPEIHIEGCAGYIQPPNGEKLEPRVLPGASIEKFRQTYGQESKHVKEIKEWEWETNSIDLQASGFSKEEKARSIGLDVKPGHIVSTPDGIELGKDTFAIVLQKMKDRGIAVSERMEGADGTWILFVSFPSVCNPDDWSEYSWFLDGSPTVDSAVGNSIPFHSSVFLQRVAEYYSLGAGKESEGDIEGQPATHE
jgi:hypothetical protein